MSVRSFWLLPLDGHVCAIDRRGVVHASHWTEAHPRKRGKRRTVPTVCGLKRAGLLVHNAVGPGGEDHGVIAASWPPPVEVHPRCPTCWEATGRKRPHRSWRTVQPADAGDPRWTHPDAPLGVTGGCEGRVGEVGCDGAGEGSEGL